MTGNKIILRKAWVSDVFARTEITLPAVNKTKRYTAISDNFHSRLTSKLRIVCFSFSLLVFPIFWDSHTAMSMIIAFFGR